MFLKVDYDLLKCEAYNTATKLVIAYLHGLQSAGRSFWGSSAYLASFFGTTSGKMESLLWDMQEKGLIKKTADGYILAMKWEDILRKGFTIDRDED